MKATSGHDFGSDSFSIHKVTAFYQMEIFWEFNVYKKALVNGLGNQRPDCTQYARLLSSGNQKSLPLTPTDTGTNPGQASHSIPSVSDCFRTNLSPYLGFFCYNPRGTCSSILRRVGASRMCPWTIRWPVYVPRERQNQGGRRDKMSPALSLLFWPWINSVLIQLLWLILQLCEQSQQLTNQFLSS